jgi:hypothetical protein
MDVHPAVRETILPIRREPTVELRARVVVPEPGSYDLRVKGYATPPPDDPHAVYSPATGNWLSVKLVNVVTGERVDPVSTPLLRYHQLPELPARHSR